MLVPVGVEELVPGPVGQVDGVGPEEEHEEDDEDLLGGDGRLGDATHAGRGEGGGGGHWGRGRGAHRRGRWHTWCVLRSPGYHLLDSLIILGIRVS